MSLATGIAAEILGDTPNGRLHEALVASGKAAQVFNSMSTCASPALLLFGAVVKKGEPLEPVQADDGRRHRRQFGEDAG